MEQLAIEGGAKLREKPLPSRRDVGAEEMKELVDVIFSGNMYRVGGTKVDEFEREFAKLYGVEHAVASTSGTAAIHVALGAINPDPGSEIVTGPISDIGTIIPILYQNCIPIFADIDPVTYSLDPDSVRRKITDKTVAVIAIHLFGQAANMDELVDVCKEHDLYLIEDASQAHLAEYKGKLAGTIGDLGCFSLQQSKQMTTGDGGVTITNDLDLAERAKLFADKAWPREGGWTQRGYLFLAMNYRMTELQGGGGSCPAEEGEKRCRKEEESWGNANQHDTGPEGGQSSLHRRGLKALVLALSVHDRPVPPKGNSREVCKGPFSRRHTL
jgi:dTDP-4-amino-4,6-dideoxygalactose transaminase